MYIYIFNNVICSWPVRAIIVLITLMVWILTLAGRFFGQKIHFTIIIFHFNASSSTDGLSINWVTRWYLLKTFFERKNWEPLKRIWPISFSVLRDHGNSRKYKWGVIWEGLISINWVTRWYLSSLQEKVGNLLNIFSLFKKIQENISDRVIL